MARHWYVFIFLAVLWIVRSYEKPILPVILAYWIVYLLSSDSMALTNDGEFMILGRNTTGTINELKAQIWLLEQGYEVFSNVKATGIADLIAWNIKTNQVLKVDVKTVKVYLKQDGSKSYIFSSLGTVGNKAIESKTDSNITYLGYCEEEDLFLWY